MPTSPVDGQQSTRSTPIRAMICWYWSGQPLAISFLVKLIFNFVGDGSILPG